MMAQIGSEFDTALQTTYHRFNIYLRYVGGILQSIKGLVLVMMGILPAFYVTIPHVLECHSYATLLSYFATNFKS